MCTAKYSVVSFMFLSNFVTDITSANKMLFYCNMVIVLIKNKLALRHFCLAGLLLWKHRWMESLLELLKGWSHGKHNFRLAD